MKSPVEKRAPQGIVDYFALALTTCGVGYIPGAPGTYGSAVGVAIYFGFNVLLSMTIFAPFVRQTDARQLLANVFAVAALTALSLVGIWASGRSISLLGNDDPSEAVIDEVMGQLVTFSFVSFTMSWWIIIPGFLLFRFFDIVKPFPINDLQDLKGGLGVCADDLVAGVYAGICLAIWNLIFLYI